MPREITLVHQVVINELFENIFFHRNLLIRLSRCDEHQLAAWICLWALRGIQIMRAGDAVGAHMIVVGMPPSTVTCHPRRTSQPDYR
jgi:hypothetical protein